MGAFFLLTLGLDLMLFHGVLSIQGFQSSDYNLPLSAPGQIAIATFSGWNYQNIGTPNGFATWLLGYGWLGLLSGSPSATQNWFYIASVPVSSLSAFVLLTRCKVQPIVRWPAALAFQFSPWLIGEFTVGEPVFTWLYALLPLAIAEIISVGRNPTDVRRYLSTAAILACSSAFTLQALPVIAIASLPWIAQLSITRGRKAFAAILLALILGAAASVSVNYQALTTYALTLEPVAASSPAALFGGFLSPEGQLLRIWLVVLSAATILPLVIQPLRHTSRTTLYFGLSFLALAFTGLYLSIPSQFAASLFQHIPVLDPFLDADKFLLVAWFALWTNVSLLISETLSSGGSNVVVPAPGGPGRTSLHSGPSSSRALRSRRHVRLSATAFALAILLLSSAFVNFHGVGGVTDGLHYLRGEFAFSASQVSQSYYDLRDFLLSNGAGYGLSFHTLVVPQNPGAYLPSAVGSVLIPGFLGPSLLMENLTTGIAQNISETTQLMAIAGVRYIAVLPNPPGLWYPTLASAPPSVGSFSSGEYFPQGNVTTYSRILGSWSSLDLVLRTANLLVYRNFAYSSPVLGYSSLRTTAQLLAGNFTTTLNTTHISANLVVGGQSVGTSNWSVDPGPNGTLLSNGTFLIGGGSFGATASQTLFLEPNTSYIVQFHLSTNPGYSFYPKTGQPTYVAVYWDDLHSTFQYPTGAAIYPPILGAVNASFEFVFRTPGLNRSIPASLYLLAEGPNSTAPIYTRFTSITIYAIDGTSEFAHFFVPPRVSVTGYTRFTLTSQPNETLSRYVTLDTQYAPGWIVEGTSQSTVHGFPGAFGLLTFRIPDNTTSFTIYYEPQQSYTSQVLVTVASSTVIPLALVVAFVVDRITKRKRRMTRSR